jgi:predicted ABC-type ATPase
MSDAGDLLQSELATLGEHEPFLIVLAGPNGAGKSTFYQLVISGQTQVPFVNADLIEKEYGLTLGTYEAAQAAEQRRRELLLRGQSFCMETVFSDPLGAKVQFLQEAQSRGFYVLLIYVGLQSAALSEMRVAHRVNHGGHDVPVEKLRSRFSRSLHNLAQALTFVDVAYLLDNSNATTAYRFVAKLQRGTLLAKSIEPFAWCKDILKTPHS